MNTKPPAKKLPTNAALATPELYSVLDEEYLDVTHIEPLVYPPLSTATDTSIKPDAPALGHIDAQNSAEPSNLRVPTSSSDPQISTHTARGNVSRATTVLDALNLPPPTPHQPTTPLNCPVAIEHDPRETGNRLYQGRFEVPGKPGVFETRGIAHDAASYQQRMRAYKAQGCANIKTTVSDLNQVSSRKAGDIAWETVAWAMVGGAVGFLVAERMLS